MSVRLVCPSCGQIYRTAGETLGDAAGLAEKGCQECGCDELEVLDGWNLPRKPEVDYSDLERLSTVRVIGAAGNPLDGWYPMERDE